MTPGSAEQAATGSLVVLMPVFNDWESVALLIPRLDATLRQCAPESRLVLVDDASTEPPPDRLTEGPLENIRSIEIVRLARNLGHQRAIAIGLVHVQQTIPCRAVVVMDADGEDRPEDVLTLVKRMGQERDRQIVFGARARRMESLTFRAFYHLYRALHRVLTGAPVRVGNFSVVPSSALRRLMVVWELWNHYAAAVIHSGLAHSSVPLARDRRLRSRSRMKFSGLVVHGWSALSVYGEVVSVRLLLAGLGLSGLAAVLMATTLFLRLGTGLAVPGWALYALASLLVLAVEGVLGAGVLGFVLIGGRSNTSFLPIRDAHYFIVETIRVFPNA
ncbi:MAG: glycosyltransferase [Bryobacteraceae bacterium]